VKVVRWDELDERRRRADHPSTQNPKAGYSHVPSRCAAANRYGLWKDQDRRCRLPTIAGSDLCWRHAKIESEGEPMPAPTKAAISRTFLADKLIEFRYRYDCAHNRHPETESDRAAIRAWFENGGTRAFEDL
jgi:hypothetical protein